MAGLVLDASALIAMLEREPGADIVTDAIGGSIMSSVNWTEVATFYARIGGSADEIERYLRPLPVDIVDATRDHALIAVVMMPKTRGAGLSLGDRFCLALAREQAVPVLTADKAWSAVAEAIGVEVRLIR